MILIWEDTRQKDGKHELKHEYFRFAGVEWKRKTLKIGDYTLPYNDSVCVDTKNGLQEVISNVCTSGKKKYLKETDDISKADGIDRKGRPYKYVGGHKRFKDECIRAQEKGVKLIILVETDEIKEWHDLIYWHNPRRVEHPKATTGEQLFSSLATMHERYGVEWRLCKPIDAGRTVLKLLGVEDRTDYKAWLDHWERHLIEVET